MSRVRYDPELMELDGDEAVYYHSPNGLEPCDYACNGALGDLVAQVYNAARANPVLPKKVSHNDDVWVKLTYWGVLRLAIYGRDQWKFLKHNGWIKLHIWRLMEIFGGDHRSLWGNVSPFVDGHIWFETPEGVEEDSDEISDRS